MRYGRVLRVAPEEILLRVRAAEDNVAEQVQTADESELGEGEVGVVVDQ